MKLPINTLATLTCLADSTTDPIGSITGIEPGWLVQIVVQAVNGNLQGLASALIEFRIPPATTKATVPSIAHTAARSASDATHTAGTAAIGYSNGNGHRNGNGRSTTVQHS